MKIVGQSTAVSGTPYVHLGYLAATYMKPNMSLLSGGMVAITLGIAMAFSLIASKRASGLTDFNFVRRRSRRLLWGGISLMVLGVVSVALAVATSEKTFMHPVHVTHYHGELILQALAERSEQNQRTPSDLSALDLHRDVLADGWMHRMKLVHADVQSSKGYSIVSAGPDGRFGTADDIHMSPEPDGPPRGDV
jgi:hypothetical protein